MSQAPIEYPPRTERGRRQTVVAWTVVALLVLWMFGTAGVLYVVIGNHGRHYNYRTQPYIPASAYSATAPAPTATTTAPKQVELPPATVGKRAKER